MHTHRKLTCPVLISVVTCGIRPPSVQTTDGGGFASLGASTNSDAARQGSPCKT
jgi:hypothetical protein